MTCDKAGATFLERGFQSRRIASAVQVQVGSTDSTLFMFCIAVSASASVEKRTKPKPRLRPVSRSLTTTCDEVSKSVPLRACCAMSTTHGLFDLAELLELLAQSLVIGMPRKTSVSWSVVELR